MIELQEYYQIKVFFCIIAAISVEEVFTCTLFLFLIMDYMIFEASLAKFDYLEIYVECGLLSF